MYKSIKIQNFRGIQDLEINGIKQINLIAGKNSVGKTTILDALFLLISPVNPQLTAKINQFRRIGYDKSFWLSYIYAFSSIDKAILEANIEKNKKKEIRKLSIYPYYIDNEIRVSTELNKMVSASSDVESEPIGLEHYFELKEGKKKKPLAVTSRISYTQSEIDQKQSLDANMSLVLIKTQYKAVRILDEFENKNGEPYNESWGGNYLNQHTTQDNNDLANRFDAVIECGLLDKIISTLRKIEPNLESMALDASQLIKCTMKGSQKRFNINMLGGGINNILPILLTIPTARDGVLLIDEIDRGLHYSSFDALWKTIYDLAREYNVQIFATTHSGDCIRSFFEWDETEEDDIRVFRIEKKNNKHRVVTFDEEALSEFIEQGLEIT